jgi:peptidoglycan/xylan/chitin deacetylase (PgdA/CDA1 family)
MNRYKKRILLNIAFIVIAGGALIYFLFFYGRDNDTQTVNGTQTLYDSVSDINQALASLAGKEGKAEVISSINTSEKVAVLTFDGMFNQETGQKLVSLLNQYDVKAVFFLPGISAAEDSDMVKLLSESGQTIGNYTLSARKHLEELTKEDLVEDFVKTNRILLDITGTAPGLLKANVTEYTEDFLYAAYASGLKQVIKSDYYLNYQSFSNEKAALEFLKGIKRGAVISFKTDSALDESEYANAKKPEEEKPAIDKEPGIETKEEIAVNKDTAFLQNVEYLLKAMTEENYSFVAVDELNLYKDTDYDFDFTQLRSLNKGKLAKVYKNISTALPSVALSFRGIGDEDKVTKMLEFLKEKDLKATFFVTGEEILSYPERIEAIIKDGHQLGNGGLSGASLETVDFEKAAFEIYKTDVLLKEKYKINTKLFMPVYGKYNDKVREAASALGYKVITYSKNPVTEDGSTLHSLLLYFKNGFRQGDILFFRLDYHDDIVKIVSKTYELLENSSKTVALVKDMLTKPFVLPAPNSKPVPLKPEGSKGSGGKKPDKVITVTPKPEEPQKEEDKDPYQVDKTPDNYAGMRKHNQGKTAVQLTNLYTTQPVVSFVFRDISNREALLKVLKELDRLNAKGTFFITGKEIMKYKSNIDEIVKHGQDIANGGYGMNSNNPSTLSYEEISYEIDMGERYLKAYLGDAYDDTINKYYMPMYADAGGKVLEAAKALGYEKVITYNRSTMTKAYQNLSAEEIIKKYYTNMSALYRGDIVYFRLDYLTKKEETSKLVYQTGTKLVKNATYDIVSVADLAESDLIYVPKSRTDAAGSTLVKKAYGYPEDNLLKKLFTHYIGNPFIDSSEVLHGLTEAEIKRIDTTGKIDTKGEKVIFLTFDDWGYDDNITKLLNVLKKYNVEASFFVRVGNEKMSFDSDFTNPNLLRAIALEGHDIGNHTFRHMKVDITTQAEKELLQQDILTAHQEMSRYIGDTGNLKLLFRPPTLAVSKLGLETVFDSGYEYIVNGDFSSHDYEAASAEELIHKLKYGINEDDESQWVTEDTPEDSVLRIESGSIVVMHMSEDARYTPEALDTVIPYYMAKGYRFAKLSDYLKNGYEQSSGNQSLD